MAQRKVERLLNLVICLLNTRRPITAAQIHDIVAGYPDGDEAFARMFERDKSELRELGIPVTVEALSSWDDEFGYRIRPGDYALPDIDLAPDEAAALALAARFWQQASLAGAASGAMLKLRAAGVDTGDVSRTGVELSITSSEPAFGGVWAAVQQRRAMTFTYQNPQAPAPAARTIEPWGLVSWHGRWYVAGHDRERGEPRVFRLDRIRGTVKLIGKAGDVVPPTDVDIREMVHGRFGDDARQRSARIRVRRGAGVGLRRRATSVTPDDADHDVVELAFGNGHVLADEVAEYGADAVLLEPSDVRDAVIARLQAAAS
ncbi:MAG: helix-turn-helix transcriptional regulator [Actinomycetes bacterium]